MEGEKNQSVLDCFQARYAEAQCMCRLCQHQEFCYKLYDEKRKKEEEKEQ